MSTTTFDDLVQRLAHTSTRRRAFALLGSLATGSVLGEPAQAGKKKKPCPPCKRRTKGKCKKRLPDGTACAGGTCQGGVCVPVTPATGTTTPRPCPDKQTLCGSLCVNLANDLSNCGVCGRRCSSNECRNGTCSCFGGAPCPAGCACVRATDQYYVCSGTYPTQQPCVNPGECPVGSACQDESNRCTATC